MHKHNKDTHSLFCFWETNACAELKAFYPMRLGGESGHYVENDHQPLTVVCQNWDNKSWPCAEALYFLSAIMCFTFFFTLLLLLWCCVGPWRSHSFPENRAPWASQLAKGGAGIRTQIFCLNVCSFQHTQIPANPFVAMKAHFLPSLRGIRNSCSASPIIITLHMYESCDFVPFQFPLRQVKSPRFCSS